MDQAGVRMDLIMLTKKQYLMKIILKVGKAARCKKIQSAQKLILQSVWQDRRFIVVTVLKLCTSKAVAKTKKDIVIIHRNS